MTKVEMELEGKIYKGFYFWYSSSNLLWVAEIGTYKPGRCVGEIKIDLTEENKLDAILLLM